MNDRLIVALIAALSLCACRSTHDNEDHVSGQPNPDTHASTTTASAHTPDRTTTLTDADKTFIEKASTGGLFEVESSKLALEKTGSRHQREFAEMMISDHGDANRKFGELVQRKGGMLPTGLDSEHRRMMEELREKIGKDFERGYHDLQVEAHDGAIKLFESAAHNCDDADLREFADKTLPTLRKHRELLDKPMEND